MFLNISCILFANLNIFIQVGTIQLKTKFSHVHDIVGMKLLMIVVLTVLFVVVITVVTIAVSSACVYLYLRSVPSTAWSTEMPTMTPKMRAAMKLCFKMNIFFNTCNNNNYRA